MTPAARGRVLTEPLGGSPLSAAMQSRSLPAAMQPWRPDGPDEWRSHAERRRDAAGTSWLPALRGALAPSGAAAERLERVAAARGVVVTTGQQPGLFGGPLYTLAKALTALELADAIEKTTGIAAAPVFWAATDDADYLEASTSFVSDADGLHELASDERPLAGTPMATARLGGIAPLIEKLRAACGSAPHAHFLELAVAAYSSEATVGGAYVRLMRGLLEPLGIAVLDASHTAYRDAARSVLRDALTGAAKVAAALTERAAAVRALGFEPQVEDDRGLSLVFALEDGLKRRVPVAEAARAASAATPLAPNVLLRPLVERELLPTVAYVGGPGELAYFVQTDAVAAALGRERLVAVPRWSCTVIEPFVEKALGRLGVQHTELRDLPALERRLARAALPESVARAWKRLTDQVQVGTQELARAVRDSGLLPPPVIDGLAGSLAYRLNRTERRLLAAAKRRDEVARRDLTASAAAIWPRGQRQERVLNFIPMLARGGDSLLRELRSAAADHAQQLVGTGQRRPAHAP